MMPTRPVEEGGAHRGLRDPTVLTGGFTGHLLFGTLIAIN